MTDSGWMVNTKDSTCREVTKNWFYTIWNQYVAYRNIHFKKITFFLGSAMIVVDTINKFSSEKQKLFLWYNILCRFFFFFIIFLKWTLFSTRFITSILKLIWFFYCSRRVYWNGINQVSLQCLFLSLKKVIVTKQYY